MSQRNVDTVRALFEEWASGARDFEGSAQLFDPSVELESPLSSVVGEPYRGHEGMEQWVRDIDEQFLAWRMDITEIRDLGDNVLAIGVVGGRGRASGAAVEFPSAVMLRFGQDGRITRVRIYRDVSDALKAVGLAE